MVQSIFRMHMMTADIGVVQRCAKLVDLKQYQKMYILNTKYALAKSGFDTAENEPFKVCLCLSTTLPKVINTALETSVN